MSEAYYELLRRYNALQERCSELQHRVDTHSAADQIRAALDRLDTKKADVANIEAFLRGANLRVVADVAMVDMPGDDGQITCSLDEALSFMEGRPAEFGNLFNVEKPPEKSPQQKRFDEIGGMTMDQYLAGRKQPGFYDPRPEPPQE